MLTHDDTMQLMNRHADLHRRHLTYHDGVVTQPPTSPRSGEFGFAIGPDQFRNRFVVEVPVDGFGQPRIFLSLRQICSNGRAVGYARVP